jgi:hypothetical protein
MEGDPIDEAEASIPIIVANETSSSPSSSNARRMSGTMRRNVAISTLQTPAPALDPPLLQEDDNEDNPAVKRARLTKDTTSAALVVP